MAEMKSRHLLASEVTYELRIRGVTTNRDKDEKRKILGRLLAKERGRALDYSDPDFDYESEKQAITETLESIRLQIVDFEGPSTDSMFLRLNSRLIHITGRVQRLVVDAGNDEAVTFKNESYATCIGLEAELYERVTKKDVQATDVAPVQTPLVVQTSQPNRSTPVHKWGVKFDGIGKDGGVKAFLERVEELRVARGVSEEDLYTSAVDLFEGKALLWYRSVRDTAKNWQALVSLLKRSFLPSDYDDRLWEEIKRRKQGRSESVTIYIAVMESLFNRLSTPPALVTKIKYVKLNLLPDISNQVALSDFDSMEGLERACVKLEEHFAAVNRGRGLATRTFEPDLAYSEAGRSEEDRRRCYGRLGNHGAAVQGRGNTVGDPHNGRVTGYSPGSSLSARKAGSNPQRRSSERSNRAQSGGLSGHEVEKRSVESHTPMVCYNCRQPNHTFRHCTLKGNKFCFRCGQQGVTVSDCGRCSGNAKRE